MPRTLHLALAPLGVGGPGQDGLWKDARVAKDASVDIDYYLNRREPLTLLSAVGLGLPFPANRYTRERQLTAI